MKKIIIPMFLLLTACSTTVEDKYHVPEFERIKEECFQTGRLGCEDGKDVTIKIPECWRLIIENSWGVEKEICIDKESWNNTYVGQEWK